MPNLYMCSIQMSSKYTLGIGLIASSLENRHLGLIQSRVREGTQRGVSQDTIYYQNIWLRTLESISLWKPDSYCYIYQVK